MKNILREDEYQELVSATEGQTLDAVFGDCNLNCVSACF